MENLRLYNILCVSISVLIHLGFTLNHITVWQLRTLYFRYKFLSNFRWISLSHDSIKVFFFVMIPVISDDDVYDEHFFYLTDNRSSISDQSIICAHTQSKIIIILYTQSSSSSSFLCTTWRRGAGTVGGHVVKDEWNAFE